MPQEQVVDPEEMEEFIDERWHGRNKPEPYRQGTLELFQEGKTGRCYPQCLRPRGDRVVEILIVDQEELFNRTVQDEWSTVRQQECVVDGQVTSAQKGDVRVGTLRRQKMSKEKIYGGSFWVTTWSHFLLTIDYIESYLIVDCIRVETHSRRPWNANHSWRRV
jgi:hypothetical protein